VRLGARIAFAVSLAANATALYLLVPESVPVVDAPLALAPSAPPPAAVSEAGDAHAYLEALLARGLSREETKPLVLARLLAESANANDSRAASEYWRSDYSVAVIEGGGRRIAAADRVRATLLGVYGPSARRDPVFASLFAPLDTRYAFLASEQQLALQKLQLERLLAQAKSPPAGAAPPPTSVGGASSRASVTAEVLQDVRSRLGSSAALEYAYRFSPLAEQLRSAGLELSGAEFRIAFDALLQFETTAADPRSFARTRESLRSTLGEARFTRLWAARDPYFGVIAAAGRQHGLADGTVLAAYAIFNDSQDRFAAVADRYATADPPSAGAELHRVQDDMRQRLAALVGEDAATALLRATARLSVSTQSPSTTNLRE
jgi:hypothetical protein